MPPETENARSIRELVERHDRDLYRGNGRPGITTRIKSLEDCMDGVDLSRLENRVSNLERFLAESASRRETKINLILAAMLAIIGGFLLQHFKII